MEEEENLPIHKSSFEKPVTKSSFDKLSKAYSNNLYYNTGFGKSSYDESFNFDSQFNELDPTGSINENRAQTQSNLAKIGAGIGRIGTKAVSEIAKMPGVVGGIIAAPFAEEGKGWETAFNNQWIKSISQLNEDVNAELLPVYVKKAVSEGNLWDNISSIDFWATEGADGIGFIASMFAPGAALKSLNLGHKVLGATAKGLSMVNGETKLAGAVRTLEGLGITANNIDLGAMTMANTLFESGSEAGSAMDSFQKDLDRKLASGEIDQFQYEQLQTQKAKLGRDIFISNLAILLVPNAIQTKMIWGKGVGSQLVKDTPSLMAKIGNRGKNVLGALGSEGFLEEGTQSTVETIFTNKAKRGELTDNMSQDFNISELVSNYIDTLNTTEGQKAIFLGGILGGGMSAYEGGKSDIATRKETQNILSLTEEKVGAFNKVNETDVYKRDQNGDIVYNYNNKPQYDPVKVRDVAKALEYTEEQSQLFDQAIQEGNTQVIQTLKNEAINQLITPFINKGELGIQALSQYLDTTLKTEEIAENEDAKALKSKIIEQATYMQDQLNTYKDFSKSLINLNNPDATEQDTIDYYNRLGDVYINLKGSEYFQKGELKKLNIQKSKLLKDLGTTEISTELNPDYIEGKTEEIYKFNNKPVDARVKLLNEQIEQVDKKLSEIDKIINDEIWNDEKVNKSFDKKVKENNKLREQASLENEAIVDQATETIANATTIDELKNIPKTNTSTDIVVQKQAETKKVEIIEAEKVANAEEIATATQEDNDFNNVQTYDGLTSTEGSIITDELIPQQAENNSTEELKSIQNSEVDNGLGVKVISTDRNTGLPLQFMTEQFPLYLNYEREPVNKSGKEVGFEINQNVGKSSISEIEKRRQEELKSEEYRIITKSELFKDSEGTFYKVQKLKNGKNKVVISDEKGVTLSDLGTFEGTVTLDTLINGKEGSYGSAVNGRVTITKVKDLDFTNRIVDKINTKYDAEIKSQPKVNPKVVAALNAFNNKDFSNPKLLIDFLPINVQFTNEVKAPIETRRVTDEINPATELLRISIVNHLINGGSITDIKTTIQDQYKGLLKVDENRFANNNILELDGVPNLKYVRDNLYVVDSFGNLMNIQSGKTKTFSNGKTKKNAAGEIYLSIPQANGKPFPLKLNIKKISESEAVLLYEIYKEIITNEKSLNTTISETNPELQEAILKSFEPELNIIGGNKNDIKLQEIVDLLIYQSNNIKSRMQIENGVLYYGENEANINNIEESQNAIINFLVDSKRHQIKINPKFATDNTKTNLKSNSADYLKYLVDNNILSTNAVVNEPTFQGYTNIYLNTGITVNNQTRSTQKVAEVSSKNVDVEKRIKIKDINKKKEELNKTIENTIDEKSETKNSTAGFSLAPGIKETSFGYIDEKIINSVPLTRDEQIKIKTVWTQFEDGDIDSRQRRQELFKIEKEIANRLIKEYDAELADLNQPKVSEQGVQISADDMGLAGAFDVAEMGSDVLDILKEFETEPKVENKYIIDPLEYEKSLIEEEMILELSRNKTQSKYKNAEVYKEIENKVKNKEKFNGFTSDEYIKIAHNLLVSKNKDGILALDGLNEIKRYITNFEEKNKDFFKTQQGLSAFAAYNPKYGYWKLALEAIDFIMDVKSEKEIIDKYNTKLANLENKSENIRNVQENFLSLSEIKGTVENTELKETQAEVFNENKIPPTATEMRLINKAITVYQEDASKLTESQKKRLEEYATNYPESWKKICK